MRSPSSTDRRATVVELSEQGRALLPKLKAAWRRIAEQTVAGLTPTQVDQLTATLADLASSLSAVDVAATDIPRYVPAKR
jgi:DNA-binding MarR family transcriptional regulator